MNEEYGVKLKKKCEQKTEFLIQMAKINIHEVE